VARFGTAFVYGLIKGMPGTRLQGCLPGKLLV
jgi:hypothetical protein